VLVSPGLSGYPWPEDPGPHAEFTSLAAWLANGDFEQPDPPAVDRLGEIAVPAVLMIGDQDHPPLIECDEMIVAGIPGCRKIEVPGGDHLLPLRVPALVADAITELAG
jgi:pimeloyl-ACP methyl ester carboxylesterase